MGYCITSFATRHDARRATKRCAKVFYDRGPPDSSNTGLPPATAMVNFTTETSLLMPLPNRKTRPTFELR